MIKYIDNNLIRSFRPCYDPSEIGIPDNKALSVKEWIITYRNDVRSLSDIIWLVCRPCFITEKDLRLFAVWCAKEVLKLLINPNPLIIEACNIAENYANGLITEELLKNAYSLVRNIDYPFVRAVVRYDAEDAARIAATWAAARIANIYHTHDAIINGKTALYNAKNNQIDKLLTYFNQ